MDAVFEDIFPDAVKIGMLSTPECMQAVAEKLTEYKPQNVVVDPVMYAKNGCALMQPYAIDTLIKTIIPLADVLTPNIPEAEKLPEWKLKPLLIWKLLRRKSALWAARVLWLKAGTISAMRWMCFLTARSFTTLKPSASIPKHARHRLHFFIGNSRNLANGLNVAKAVKNAKSYVTKAIEHSLAIGKGCGPTHHFVDLYRKAGMLE